MSVCLCVCVSVCLCVCVSVCLCVCVSVGSGRWVGVEERGCGGERAREREREKERARKCTAVPIEAKETYYRGKRDLL